MGTISQSADTKAPPGLAAKTVLAPESWPKWFNDCRVVKASPNWPAVGSQLTVAVGKGDRWTFALTVTENRLPAEIRMHAVTPSAESDITHRYEPLPGGGSRITKTVEPHHKGIQALFAPLMNLLLPGWVRKEVTLAAKVADEAA